MSCVSRIDLGQVIRFIPKEERSSLACVSKSFRSAVNPRVPEEVCSEIWQHVFSYLGERKAYQFAGVCKSLREVAQEESCWRLQRLKSNPMGAWAAANIAILQDASAAPTEQLKNWAKVLFQVKALEVPSLLFLSDFQNLDSLRIFKTGHCPVGLLEKTLSEQPWGRFLTIKLPSLRELEVLDPEAKIDAIEILIIHYIVEGDWNSITSLISEIELNAIGVIALAIRAKKPLITKKLVEYLKAKGQIQGDFCLAYLFAYQLRDFDSIRLLISEGCDGSVKPSNLNWVLQNYEPMELREVLQLLGPERLTQPVFIQLIHAIREQVSAGIMSVRLQRNLDILEREFWFRFPGVPIDREVEREVERETPPQLESVARRVAPIALSLLVCAGIGLWLKEPNVAVLPGTIILASMGYKWLPVPDLGNKQFLGVLLGGLLLLRKSNPAWVKGGTLAGIVLLTGAFMRESSRFNTSSEQFLRDCLPIAAAMTVSLALLES